VLDPQKLEFGGTWMIETFFSLDFPLSWMGATLTGKLAFVGVFVCLLVGLFCLPKQMIQLNSKEESPAWWQNARLWATIIILIQITIYLWWG